MPMDGIDKIIGQIETDARREAAALKEQAEAQAREVRNRGQARGEREAARILEEGRVTAAGREERLVSAARLEERKKLLALKQRLVGRAFERALEGLCALPEEEQIDFLSRLAAAAALTGRERVALSPADRARWGGQVVLRANAALGERGCLTLSEDSRDIKGGLILEGEQAEVNCSFEALVREQREPLAVQVARLLFDAGD